MSERQSNPEKSKQRFFDNCNSCKKDYDLTPKNAKLHTHDVDPDCNYLYCVCTNCQGTCIMYVGTDVTARAQEIGIPVEHTQYPTDRIKGLRLKMLGIELAEPVEVTARMEKLIGRFALTMEKCPPELLYDLITDENDSKPYPLRWK